jgi:HEAT repeat protein
MARISAKGGLVIGLLSMLACSTVVLSDGPPDKSKGSAPGPSPQEKVVRTFMRAMWMNNLKELQQVCLAAPDMEVLARGPVPTGKQLPKVQEFLKRLEVKRLEVKRAEGKGQATAPREDKPNQRHIYGIRSGRPYIPVHVQKTDKGWKVDPRWWIASCKPWGKPEKVAKMFLSALFDKDPMDMANVVVPSDDVWVLTAGRKSPGADVGHLCSLAAEMPVVRMKKGESFTNREGKEVVITKQHVNKNRLLLVGLFYKTEISFQMVKVNGKWLVDRSEEIAEVIKRLPKAEQLSGRAEYASRLLRARAENALSKGDVASLRKLLKQGMPQKLKNSLLQAGVWQYWYRNQGKKPSPQSNHYKMIEALLDSGADTEVFDGDGYTPLMFAIRHYAGAHLVELLAKKANVNAANAGGDTPLSLSAKGGEIYKILKRAGATEEASAKAVREVKRRRVKSLRQRLDPNDIDKLSVVRYLSYMGAEAKEAVPAIIKVLNQSEGSDYREMIKALGNLGPVAKEALPHISKALKSDNSEIRSAAATALLRIQPTREREKIVAGLLTDDGWHVARDAASALGEVKATGPVVVSCLIKALKHKDSSVRTEAAVALGATGKAGPEVVAALREALKDEIPIVKISAEKSLKKLGYTSEKD